MSFTLECRKMKRTGFMSAFLCGGLMAAAVPVLNMAVRSEIYQGLDGSPVRILLDANWQLMAMLNVLLAVLGACILYHTEYADRAIWKMSVLPKKEWKLFFGKAALLTSMCILVLLTEAAGVAFCLQYWFEPSREVWAEAVQSFGYALLLMLPAAFISLFTASVCKNMWVSLGIGVVCVFTATVIPAGNFVLSLFPFALPFRIYGGTAENTVRGFMAAAVGEVLAAWIAEVIFLKVRRNV
ncbi:MAG: ABC transporter permease [bacterium]|nr:ABC transporter permease [bacterium]